MVTPSAPACIVIDQLFTEIKQIDVPILECYISVGMITKKMFDVLIRTTSKTQSLSIITGIHMPTPPEIFQELKLLTEENKIKSGIITDNFFHPKLYLFKLINGWLGFVGSGNLTYGGWFKNEELFLKVTDQTICAELLSKHLHWTKKAKPIDETFLQLYKGAFEMKNILDSQNRKETKNLIDRLNNNFNIDIINFTNQFFTREDHEAFEGAKIHLNTPEVLEERRSVSRKLYELNELITQAMPVLWDIFPHYDDQHIVSGITTDNHHFERVQGLWTAFGRSRLALKQYGKNNTTPLYFMRMQVIVGYDYVGTWLMPGKSQAGQIDRDYLRLQIRNEQYLSSFFNALTSLGDEYWIEVANDERIVTSFKTPSELFKYLLNDNVKHYFTIGRNYRLGSPELLVNNILNTIMADFTKYFPIYEMIRDKSFDNVK